MRSHKWLLLAPLGLALCLAGVKVRPASAQSAPAQQPGQASSDSLPIPANEIIRRFAENEAQFKLERDNYTYSQSVIVTAGTVDGRDGGKFQQDSDIIFTPQGKRIEKVTFAPTNTL